MEISTICGPLSVNDDLGPWQIRAEAASPEDGVQIVSFALSAPAKSAPPKFAVSFAIPLDDVQMRWTPLRGNNCFVPPEWMSTVITSLAHGMPLMALINTAGQNRLTFAVSEASRRLEFTSGTNEEHVTIRTVIKFLPAEALPRVCYLFQ